MADLWPMLKVSVLATCPQCLIEIVEYGCLAVGALLAYRYRDASGCPPPAPYLRPPTRPVFSKACFLSTGVQTSLQPRIADRHQTTSHF